MATVRLFADTAPLVSECNELAARLEVFKFRKRFFRKSLRKVQVALAAGGDELFRLDTLPTSDAGELVVQARLGGRLKDLLQTLRAVQGDGFV